MVWYFLEKTGTSTDTCNPYTSGSAGVTGTCPTTCKDKSAIVLTKAAGTASNVCTSETSIMTALVTSPLTTGFTVYYDFELYTSGIYQHVWGPEMGGHAVEFVGYGTANNTKFWKVKNSWGATWGEKGYFRILKGADECGIEDECYLPSV
jgi:C1A family cysteine protease